MTSTDDIRKLQCAAGFTLVEVLVALAVFSIAVLALLNAQGEHVRAAVAIESRAFARIVAENRLIEATAGPRLPEPGVISGQEQMAGRQWYWTQQAAVTANDRMLRIDVRVRDAPDGNVIAALNGFRRLEEEQ